VALLIARIPNEKLQAEALKECFDYNKDPVSYREVNAEIQRRWMLRLTDAPFDTRDAELVKAAGPCATCPKRTGNQKELFADISSADVCTDPACFESKRDAHVARELEKAREQGLEARSAQESKSLFASYGDEPRATHVDLDDVCTPLGWNHKRTWRTVLGKFAPPAIAAVDPKGNLRKLVTAEDAKAALKAAGVKIEKSSSGSSGSYGQEERARAKRKKDLAARASAAIAEILPKAQAKAEKLDVKLWRLLAQHLHDGDAIIVAKRRGWCRTQQEAGEATNAWIESKERTAGDLVGYIIEMVLCSSYCGDWEGRVFSYELKAVADLCGVPLARATKEKAKSKPKAAKKKK
jgi:hypothetical protein